MELSERKKKILRAIVENYIRTAEPVGSKAIAALPDFTYSPATIRNEMAELTNLGLLEQPHTSAGRIPSPSGYRLYIDELMQDYRLSVDETQSLNDAMELKLRQFDEVMNQVSKMVSNLTNLPAYTMAARQSAATVKRFDLIQAEAGSIILVVMLTGDVVKNKLIKLPLDVGEQDLKTLSAVLNASLTELPVEQITPDILNRILRSAGQAASLVPIIVDYTTHLLQAQNQREVHINGQMKLLSQPEYHDVDKAQHLLTGLDEKVIANLPATVSSNNATQILVGPENISQELKDTSVVMTKFDIGDGMQGMIGVVGPTRMDYAQVTARLSYFAEGLARMFGKSELPSAEPLDTAPVENQNQEDS